MSALDPTYRTVMMAKSLKWTRGDALADFERETIDEAANRLIRDRSAVVTADELRVVSEALSAMRAAPGPSDQPDLERAA